MEFTRINKRISLPIPIAELPHRGRFNSEELAKIFDFKSPEEEKAIRTIVGEHLLNACPRLVFPSQVASCFLSNSMDLLQCFWQLTDYAVPFVHKKYVPEELVRDYDLHNGKALVGGLFKHKDLKKNSGFWSVYSAVKYGLYYEDEMAVRDAIDAHKDELGSSLCERVMETTKAMLVLIKHSDIHHSRIAAIEREGRSESD